MAPSLGSLSLSQRLRYYAEGGYSWWMKSMRACTHICLRSSSEPSPIERSIQSKLN